MPYKRTAKYYHKRQRDPDDFIKSTFKTVLIKHSDYKGKYRRKGVMAVVGKLKKCKKYCWKVQSILVPKTLKIK